MDRNKITVVGAGRVGATTTHIAAAKQLGDIVLLDIVDGLAQGKSLDLAQAGAIQLYDYQIVGTQDWAKSVDSDIVIVTSGLPRRPGMVRDDLLAKNVQIVKDVSEKIARYCPGSIIVVVCNPLDAMVYTAAKVSGFAKKKVVGMAGALDSARFSYFLASELDVSVEDIKAVLMGGHGDDMVPLPRFSSVGAYYAPAAGVVKMAEAILKDKKTVLSCCAYCNREYGVGGHFVGVPVVLGKTGVEKIIELDLNESERAQFETSLAHVKQLAAKVDKLL